MGQGVINGRMVGSTLANGSKTQWKVKGHLHGWMGEYTKGNILMTRKRAEES